MIDGLPFGIDLLFIVAAVYAIGTFYYANNRPKVATLIILIWMIVQSLLAYSGFYQVVDTIPPRFALVIIPAVVAVVIYARHHQINGLIPLRDLKKTMLIHVVRIPVEVTLLYLFFDKMIPQMMTFEGYNFDILAGASAPIIIYLWSQNKLSKSMLLVWNYIGLLLLLAVVGMAVLSAELPFQQFAFDQPNKAVTFFPYILLPATIVPLVLFTHICDILHLSDGR